VEVNPLKAIIVDIDGDYIIVANRRGDFKRIYNTYKGYRVGDEIEIPERRLVSLAPFVRVAAVAIFLLCFGLGSLGVAGYFKPVTYVSLDINPSVELSVNRFERVLRAEGLNGEGRAILGDGRVFRNMKLEEALKLLLKRAIEKNYLAPPRNAVMLTVSSVGNNVPPGLDKKLRQIAEEEIKKALPAAAEAQSSSDEGEGAEVKPNQMQGDAGIQIIVEQTTIQKHEEARKLNISQGKLLMYEKLKKIKPGVTLQEVREAPVSRIIDELEKASPGDRKGVNDNKGGKPPTVKEDDRKGNKPWPVKEPGKVQENRRNEKTENQKERKNAGEIHRPPVTPAVDEGKSSLEKDRKDKKEMIPGTGIQEKETEKNQQKQTWQEKLEGDGNDHIKVNDPVNESFKNQDPDESLSPAGDEGERNKPGENTSTGYADKPSKDDGDRPRGEKRSQKDSGGGRSFDRESSGSDKKTK
jgi:hypothetical protein